MTPRKTKRFRFRPLKQIRPTKWISLDSLKENAHVIRDIAKAYILKAPNSTPKGAPKKSFAEAMQEHKQTEQGLKQCIKDCKKIILFCSAFSIVILGYSIYLLTQNQILASLITLLLTLNMVAYALRESFTIYQIRQRSIKISFKGWLKNIFKKDSP